MVLSRQAYDDLVQRAEQLARLVDQSDRARAAGHDIALPAEIAEAIARGENPIKVLRNWRGLTQAELGASRSGLKLTQGYISQLESSERRGTTAVLRAIAQALQVPVDLLIAD